MPFCIGDQVAVSRKEPRTDGKEVYEKLFGKVIEAFNAWDRDGDHWQYKIIASNGKFIQFYEDQDIGEITITKAKD